MATHTIPSETANFEWLVDGADPPQMVRAIPAGPAQWQWGTSGGASIVRRIPLYEAAWEFNALSTSDIVKKELLRGTGVVIQVWDRNLVGDPTNLNGLLAILNYNSLSFETVHSGVGACKVQVGQEYLNAPWLEKDNILRFFVEGIERSAYYIEDVLEIPVSPEEKKSITIVGNHVGKCLEWGTIAPFDFGGPNQNKDRFWSNRTRGYVLNDLFNEIQNRLVIRHVQKDGWNGTVGSDGQVWDNSMDLEFSAGSNYGKLLEEWSEYGIEWLMSPNFKLKLGTNLGRDLSNTMVLFPLNTVVGQETTTTRRDLKTIIFAEDSSGGVSRIQDPAAITQWDRREQYVVFKEALGAGSATSSAYALLNLIKDQIKERRVKIDPLAPGRRPFVDFDLGDTVSVQFGDVRLAFRVLAIAIKVDNNNRVTAEVTLDYILEAQRKRRLRLLNNSGGGGASSGQQIVYSTGGGWDISTTPISILPLVLNAFVSTVGKVGFVIIGTCSEAQRVTVEVMYGEVVLETFEYTMPDGLQTVEATWLWTQIPQGEVPMRLRVKSSVGTFTVLDGKGQFWVEAKAIAGKQTQAPIIHITDRVPAPAEFFGVSDLYPPIQILPLAGGGIIPVNDVVPAPLVNVSDALTTPPIYSFTSTTAVGADDGWDNGTTLDTTSTSLWVGNVAGNVRSSFYKFPVPVDLTGKLILSATLSMTTNSVGTTGFSEIQLVDNIDPVSPTTHAEFTGLTLAPAIVDWAFPNSTAGGVITSASFASAVQALVTSYGNLSSILVVHRDDGSATGNRLEIRGHEAITAGAKVKLTVTYREP